MSLSITINGVELSQYLSRRTLRIERRSDFRNSATLELYMDNPIEILAGQEIIITIDGVRRFGGLINSANRKLVNWTHYTYTISATSYHQIPVRRSAIDFTVTNVTAGSVVTSIGSFLAPDGIIATPSNIDPGILLTTYEIPATQLRQILDDISEASGFLWWIDDNKNLYFKESPAVTAAPYDVDLTADPSVHMVHGFSVAENLSQYRNSQAVIGKDGVKGVSTNDAEVARMALRYGTGFYSSVLRNDNITTAVDATLTADKILKSYDSPASAVSFVTSRAGYDVNMSVNIRAPLFGISAMKSYVIDSVVITDSSSKTAGYEFIYTVSASLPDVDGGSTTKANWIDGFAQFINKNTSANSPTSPISGGTTPSGGSTLKRVKDVQEVTEGFQITLEDDTVETYTLTSIGATEFTLTDSSGFVTHFTFF